MDTATTIFLSIFGGGALITFIQFLVVRHDQKADKKDEILLEVKSVKKDVEGIKDQFEQRFDQMDRKIDDGQAIQARARILRFSDEVQSGKKCSHEAWNQAFEDISMYNDHCKKYEDFTNSKAEIAVSNIIKVHAELLEKERHGEAVFL